MTCESLRLFFREGTGDGETAAGVECNDSGAVQPPGIQWDSMNILQTRSEEADGKPGLGWLPRCPPRGSMSHLPGMETNEGEDLLVAQR